MSNDTAIGLLVEELNRLRSENSELKVRDSNVTFHCRNVMAVNEALRKKIEALMAAGDTVAARFRLEIEAELGRQPFRGAIRDTYEEFHPKKRIY